MAKKSERPKVSDQLRRIIDSCGKSRYRIAKETGIAEPTLSRFMAGQRGLSSKALDRLVALLDLQVVMPAAKQTRQTKQGR